VNETDALAYHRYLLGRRRLGLLRRQWQLYRPFVRHLTPPILDVGCGIGDFLAYCREATGVDVNPHNVRHCRARGLAAHEVTDGRFPFPDGSFGSALLDNVLEHLADPRPTLAEIRRVVRPGGTLVVAVPGRRGFAADADHRRFYDAETLKTAVEAEGFRQVASHHYPVKFAWLDRTLRQYLVWNVFRRGQDDD
jgi:SAM-dependent methyltransferase